MLTLGVLVAIATSVATAQGPGRGRDSGPRPGDGDDLVVRMMAFDKDKDGILTRTEVTDQRLNRLFDRADANKDGSVTKEELAALASKEPPSGRGGPGFGGPPRGGPGGFMGGPPRPGEILSAPIQERLELTADQKKQVADLQKQVDDSLEKILNDEQKSQLKAMRERGPGRGGPGGPGRGGRRGDDRPQ
jgi:hypothetical protein